MHCSVGLHGIPIKVPFLLQWIMLLVWFAVHGIVSYVVVAASLFIIAAKRIKVKIGKIIR